MKVPRGGNVFEVPTYNEKIRPPPALDPTQLAP